MLKAVNVTSNDACMHSQVFFHAKSKIADPSTAREFHFLHLSRQDISAQYPLCLCNMPQIQIFIKSLKNEGSSNIF